MVSLEQLGQYRIEAELGRGGVATVYRAFHLPLRRYVALKILDTSLSSNPEFVQRFEQEATLAAGLEHPNIIQVYDLGELDGYQYIAMRLIEGPTLEEAIREGGPMPPTRALGITAEIADALSYAHAQGVLHRDVKPSNVLLRAGDHPVLTDFGIARAGESLGLTRAHTLVGTPRYMSPEQVMGQSLDPRSDLYSLGVVMYEMLAGRAPFQATSTHSLLYMHVHEPPPPLVNERPDLSPGVREMVDRLLAKTPDQRYRGAAEVAAICRALMVVPGLDASDSTVVLPPLSQSQSPGTPRPMPQPGWASQPGAPTRSGSTNTSGLRSPTPPPVTPRPDTSWPAASAPPPAPASPAEPAARPSPFAPTGGASVAGRRLPVSMPVALGLVVALLALLGLFTVGRGLLSGGSPTPTAVAARTAVPTAAATTAPVAAASAAPAATAAPTAPQASGAPSPAPPAAPTAALPPANPADSSRRLGDAMAALGRRDYTSALEQANAGLKADPKDPGLAKAAVQARLGLGEQLWSQNSTREALTHFVAVLEQPLRGAASTAELREAELSAAYLWGDLILGTDLGSAVAEYGKAFRIDPNYRDVRKKFYDGNVNLAKQKIGGGDREGALRNLNAARRADPNGSELDDLFKSLTPTPQGTPGR